MTRCNRCSTVIRRNVGQPDPSGTELLQRLGNKLRTVIHTQHPRWSAGRGKHVLQLGDEPLGVIERSTRCSSDARVCSSIIDAILIALPSIVESNWKSIAHTTFGASAATCGTDDTPRTASSAAAKCDRSASRALADHRSDANVSDSAPIITVTTPIATRHVKPS
jgi:hypothetical protein